MSGFAWILCFSMSLGFDDARLAECLVELDGRDADRIEACLRELREEPDSSLRLAFVEWDKRGLSSRRRLASLLAEVGGADLCNEARTLGDDSDLEVRRAWLEFLSRRNHAAQELASRVEALSVLARADRDAELRMEALRALAALGGELAVRELEAQLYSAGREERRLAAALIGDSHLGRKRVLALAQEAFSKPSDSRLDSEVLALLLPAYGRALAEQAGAGGTQAERAPLVQGTAHPAPHVRRGARAGFEAWSTRMRLLEDGARANRLLKQFAEDGFDAAVVLDQRIRINLSWGNEPREAVQAARELQRVAEPLRTARDRGLFARATYLEGLALAVAEEEGAVATLDVAGQLLDQLLARRADLASDDPAGTHGEALRMRAMVDLSVAVLLLADGASPSATAVVERMREVHRGSLELQRVDLSSGRGARDSLDSILGGALSPLTLLFGRTDGGGPSSESTIKLQRQVGEALAVVAPRELPGFAPAGESRDSLGDPKRLDLLVGIHTTLIDSLEDWIKELRELPGDELARARILQFRQRRLMLYRELRAAEEEGEWGPLLRHRSPCSLPLWLMRDLRGEGRTEESRALAEAARAGLEESGQYQDNTVLAAEIEIAIGTSWSDENEPERAERELTKALERLQALETTQIERGGDPRAIAAIARMRSEALVSLAVNANVKLLDQARALEYFERAYELRQDDFMSVLLACYRARSGREVEARAVLEQVVPTPGLYYNLACTWALLGEHEFALNYLERELEENHVSVESRNRQREWAAKDPDLESMNDEPRFLALVETE